MMHYKVLVLCQAYICYVYGARLSFGASLWALRMLFSFKVFNFSVQSWFVAGKSSFFNSVLLYESVMRLLWFINLFSYSHNKCANMYVHVFMFDICLMEKPIELQGSIQYSFQAMPCLTTRPQGQLNKSIFCSLRPRFKSERCSWKQMKLMSIQHCSVFEQ